MKSKLKTIKKLADLQPDLENANKHTERGSSMMESSIHECGFGDSLTVDRNGVVISGNQRLETLADIKLDNPIVVQSDGSRPIVHQRIDLEAKSKQARMLALYQNRVGQVNLNWDPAILQALQVAGVGLEKLWSDEPFAGSGPQLVAAEKAGRLCYAMDIDAGCVAVCLQ